MTRERPGSSLALIVWTMVWRAQVAGKIIRVVSIDFNSRSPAQSKLKETQIELSGIKNLKGELLGAASETSSIQECYH